MKKGISLILCCLLIALWSVGSAVTYTLPEKLEKQLAIGSGLKGSFVLKTEGTNDWIPLLAPYAGAEYQIRGMISGEDLHYYVYQTDAEENQWAKTEIYRKEDILYLRSDLLPGRVYTAATAAGLADTLIPSEGGNPSIGSALMKLLDLSAEEKEKTWQPILSRYEEWLEMWLQQFAAQPEVRRQEDGSSVMDLEFTIPVSALKAGIVALAREAAEDSALRAALGTVMTDEQLNTYLNGSLASFYEAALSQLNLDFDVTLNRTVSTLGETLVSTVVLPLDPEKTGWEALTLETSEGYTSYTLRSLEKTVTLVLPETMPEADEYNVSAWFLQMPEGEAETPCETIALRADLQVKKAENTDLENRNHETDHYVLTVTQDAEKLPEGIRDSVSPFETLTAELDLHYSSKYDNRSPTTAAFDLVCRQKEGSAHLYGSVKSASPWIFTPFEIENPVPLLGMSEEETQLLLTEWMANSLLQIKPNAPEEEAGEEGAVLEGVTPEPATEAEATPEPTQGE